jgi:hypothetical protein
MKKIAIEGGIEKREGKKKPGPALRRPRMNEGRAVDAGPWDLAVVAAFLGA